MTDKNANTGDDKQSGSVLTETETAPSEAPAEQQAPIVEPVQPVQGGQVSEDYETFSADLLIDELPDANYLTTSERDFLLPGAPDDSHSLTPRQMATVASYLLQQFPGGTKLGDAIGPYDPAKRIAGTLRAKFLTGLQKDWNIVNGISGEGRMATAHEPITEKQERMLYDAIIPALMGDKPHWDPQIQAKIDRLNHTTRTLLINKGIDADDRGAVSRFMRRFEAVAGRPTRRQPGDQQAASQQVMQGAGQVANPMKGDEEPF